MGVTLSVSQLSCLHLTWFSAVQTNMLLNYLEQQSLPDSIEWFIEDQEQAFSLYYDWLLPRPLPPPPRYQQVVTLSYPSCVSSVELTDGRGGGRDGGRAKSYNVENAWSSIYHSVLSDVSEQNSAGSIYQFLSFGQLGKMRQFLSHGSLPDLQYPNNVSRYTHT